MIKRRTVGSSFAGVAVAGLGVLLGEGYHQSLVLPWYTGLDLLRVSLNVVGVDIVMRWCAIWPLAYVGIAKQILEE